MPMEDEGEGGSGMPPKSGLSSLAGLRLRLWRSRWGPQCTSAILETCLVGLHSTQVDISRLLKMHVCRSKEQPEVVKEIFELPIIAAVIGVDQEQGLDLEKNGAKTEGTHGVRADGICRNKTRKGPEKQWCRSSEADWRESCLERPVAGEAEQDQGRDGPSRSLWVQQVGRSRWLSGLTASIFSAI